MINQLDTCFPKNFIQNKLIGDLNSKYWFVYVAIKQFFYATIHHCLCKTVNGAIVTIIYKDISVSQIWPPYCTLRQAGKTFSFPSVCDVINLRIADVPSILITNSDTNNVAINFLDGSSQLNDLAPFCVISKPTPGPRFIWF